MNAKKKESNKSLKQKISELPRVTLILFIISIIFAIFVFAVQEKPSKYEAYGKVTLVNSTGEKKELIVEIASTWLSRNIGLMDRKTLDEDAGMIFIFDKVEPISMWMKDTFIPLDMFFIKENGTITNIARNTKPESTISNSSNGAVKYALETNAGISDKYGIKAGDKIILNINLKEDL